LDRERQLSGNWNIDQNGGDGRDTADLVVVKGSSNSTSKSPHHQTSVFSARVSASSTSTPRYLTVL
jgi:hypothetical protein